MSSVEHLVAVLRRRWVPLAVVVGACLVGGVVLGAASGRTYEASARVLIDSRSLPDAALQVQRGSDEPERDAATNVLLASSRDVADRVSRRLSQSADSLLDHVRVQAQENANVLEITGSDDDATRAARIANAFAREYIAERVHDDRRSLLATEDDLHRQLDAVPPGATGQRSALRNSLRRVTALWAVAGGGARIVGRAVPPTSASSLGPLRAGAIGLIVGVALALAVAFLLESLDRRPRTVESLERAYGLRALVVVPRRSPGSLEAFRILRAAVPESGGVLVASAAAGEGRTTVAIDLAHALALTGRRVVLVELDLRRPSFGRHFSLADGDGVTSALRGRASAADLLQHPLPDVPGLWVLSAGREAPNPAELLESGRLNALLDEVKDDDATVVIDAPPLVPVVDAQVLLRPGRVDATLVVARLGVTTLEDIARARAVLDRHGIEPLGLVVVDERAAGALPDSGAVAYEAEAPVVG